MYGIDMQGTVFIFASCEPLKPVSQLILHMLQLVLQPDKRLMQIQEVDSVIWDGSSPTLDEGQNINLHCRRNS